MFEVYDAALAGTAVPALPLLIACSRCCVLELSHTAVFPLSVPSGCFDGTALRCLVRLRPPSLLTAGTPLGAPLGLRGTTVTGTVARVLSMLIACTRRCVLELRHTAISALSASR